MHVGSAHGDDVGIVGRDGDRAIAVGAQGVVAPRISGGNHHNDAGLPRGLHGLAERVQRVAPMHSAAQRKIQDADVVNGL